MRTDGPMTCNEAGEYLRLTPTVVSTMGTRGLLPSHWLGGHRRYFADELDEWIKADKAASRKSAIQSEESQPTSAAGPTLAGS